MVMECILCASECHGSRDSDSISVKLRWGTHIDIQVGKSIDPANDEYDSSDGGKENPHQEGWQYVLAVHTWVPAVLFNGLIRMVSVYQALFVDGEPCQ